LVFFSGQAAGRAAAQRIDPQLELVAGLEHLAAPSLADESRSRMNLMQSFTEIADARPKPAHPVVFTGCVRSLELA
jgi:hypothetical protein